MVGLLVGLGTAPCIAFGQSLTDVAELQRISAAYRAALNRTDTLLFPPRFASKWADSTGLETEILGLLGGRPLIYTTHNRRASATVKTTSLNTGGRTGLNLNGAGNVVALWDAGNVLTSHRELIGRAVQRDTTAVGATHATHVAGTLAASGAWDIVRGMAPEIFVDSYNWVDDVAEMATAAANGLTLSNHSYGVPLGWVPNFHGDGLWAWMGDPAISNLEDFRYGWYDQLSATWDAIAVAAPNYLIVKSAGNERELQGPLNGEPHYVFNEGWKISSDVRQLDAGETGFDTIGDAGIAKNVLTVGATESAPWGIKSPEDVKMTSFSGWGPTDDGRIKPDIVAPGVQLMSAKAASDLDYGPSSGTSMATPVVTGSAALLQELYTKEFGVTPPLSSTIKGLIIHTADEAGPFPGPDYQFGWGQLNSERAALHLHQAGVSSRSAAPIPPFDSNVIEGALEAGGFLEWNVNVSEPKPFRVTLAWTDPAAEVGIAALDNRLSNLTHNVDLTVYGPSGTHFSWMLDPTHPSKPAEKGLNIRDNVEQVYFDAEPGLYTVRVQAPIVLTTDSQLFSLMIGEADEVFENEALSSVSGRVSIGGAGVQEVTVHAQGPIWTNYKTLKDGIFYLTGLPAGTYTILPEDPILRFSPPSIEVTLPQHSETIKFDVIPPVEYQFADLFESPQLLQTGETEVSHRVQSAATGGVYGLTFVFSSNQVEQLVGRKLHIDTRFDPRVFPYSGVRGNYALELSTDWALSAVDGTHLTKRVPAIWFDGSAPIPFDARIPYSVRTDSDQILFADTLSIRVDRTDDMAPVFFSNIRLPGRAYAPPGSEIAVRAGYLDGSEIRSVTALMLDRNDESVILRALPLRDSGDISGDLDIQRGDGLYSAKFIPRIEADYRLAIRSEDVHGNESTLTTDAYYSSVPFKKDNDFLFWTTYERGSRTNTHEKIFDDIGFGYSWWDELTRGQLDSDDLASFKVAVLGRHAAPIRTQTDMDEIGHYVRGGGKIILLGQHPVDDASSQWMEAEFGVRFNAATGLGLNLLGANQLLGFNATLSDDARPSSITLPPDGLPLLTLNGAVVAGRVGTSIISTITAASLTFDLARQDLLSRFLYLSSGQSETVVPPSIPAFDHAPGTTLTNEYFEATWPYQGYADFEIEVSSSSDFSQDVMPYSVHTNHARLGPFGRGLNLFARIRALNPSGITSWSEPLPFNSRPPNQPPLALASATNIVFELGHYEPIVIPSLSALFTDPEGQPLRFEVEVNPTGFFTATVQNDSLIFVPILVLSGQAVATLTAFDSEEASASIVYPVTINYVANDPPLLTSSAIQQSILHLGDTSVRNMADLFVDPNNDTLSFDIVVSTPDRLGFSVNNNVLTLIPIAAGAASFSITATDGRGGAAVYTETVTVENPVHVNQNPVVLDPVKPVALLTKTSFARSVMALFSDPDGDPLTYSLTTDSPEFIELRNDSLYANFSIPGRFTAQITATDPSLGATSVQFSFEVSGNATMDSFSDEIPQSFAVESVYPMPFSSRVTFVVQIPESGQFSLRIYGTDGREISTVTEKSVGAGSYEINWSTKNLRDGVYFYRASWSKKFLSGTLVKLK